ncbi:MAG: hypothetical protein GF328_00725 [Candidatus Latescibacteria bacterium]|nr:hypothetical protein [Candidatus Latescibacterota bacterium]
MIGGICLLSGLLAAASAVEAEDWFGEPIVTEVDHDFGSELGVADLNNDGRDDFVSVDFAGDNKLIVYLSDSTGRFTVVDTLPGFFFASNKPYALMDEDHDGATDIILLWGVDYLRLWRNDGTGHFIDTGRNLESWFPLVVGDVDGDGYEDLLAGGVDVFYGSEGGLAGEEQRLDFFLDTWPPDGYGVKDIEVGDLDGDSIPDVIVAGRSTMEWEDPPIDEEAAMIRWRRGLGNREFAPVRGHAIVTGGYGPSYSRIAMGDLDGDGDGDLVARFSDGITTYSSHVLAYDAENDTLRIVDPFLPHGIPHLIDLDGDDHLDLYLSNIWEVPGSLSSVLRGLGGGSFEHIQDLHGARAAGLGRVVSHPHADMISLSTRVGDPPIGLWPNLIGTASEVETPEESSPASAPFRVWPRIASRETWISSVSVGLKGVRFEIVDVEGRRVRRLEAGSQAIRWDLRDDHGRAVPAGVYWVGATGLGSEVKAERVVVVR